MILESLLQRLPNERRDGEKAGTSSYSVWLANALGGGPTAAGVRVNEMTALGMPAVYACIRILAESVAQLPLVLYRKVDRSRLPATEHPLYRLLHAQPNPEHTSFIWRELVMAHLASWGNAYCALYYDRGQRLREIWPLNPGRCTLRRVNGQKILTVQTEGGPSMDLGPDEFLHIPAIGYDGLMGWSPIRTHRESIAWGLATQDFSSRFFGNNAQPQGLIKAPGKIDNPEQLKKDWLARNSDEKKLGIAVLQQGMDYVQLSISPDDAQFVQTRGLQIADICRIFNVPPMMVQDYGRATWNNVEHADLAFVKHTLVPWLARIEAALNMALLSEDEQQTLFFKFRVQGLLRGDNAGRAEFYSKAVTGGWMTRNEVRELEDLDPLEGLDEPLTPVSSAQKEPDPKKGDAKPTMTEDKGDDQARAIALAAAQRLLDRELAELRDRQRAHPTHAAWLDAVNDFYRQHRGHLVRVLALGDAAAGRFLDARWRDLQDPETVKSTLQKWAEGGPGALLEAIRDATA